MNTASNSSGTDAGGDDDAGSDDDAGDSGSPDQCELLFADFQFVIEGAVKRGLVAGVETPDCGCWVSAVGMAEPDVVLAPDRLLRIGSVTKTFTAATVLILVSDDVLSLEDTVDQYLAGIPNGDVITILQLLNHTSGLFDIINDTAFMQNAFANPTEPIPPEDLVAVAASHAPLFEPGTQAGYCNTNFHVLGLIINNIVGQDVASVIEARALSPLGLSDTRLEGAESLNGSLVPGFSPEGEDLTGVLHPTIRWTAGAMVSPIGELLTWTSGLYRGQLLAPDVQAAMLADPVAAGPVWFGLGVVIRDIPEVGEVYGHSGEVPGYRASMLYIPSLDSSVAVIANQTDTDAVSIADALAATISAHAD